MRDSSFSAALLLLTGTLLVHAQSGPATPPESERALAREIYKEMVEIKSGYTTGATTPVAEGILATPTRHRSAPSRRGERAQSGSPGRGESE